jgi:hypothetical protein
MYHRARQHPFPRDRRGIRRPGTPGRSRRGCATRADCCLPGMLCARVSHADEIGRSAEPGVPGTRVGRHRGHRGGLRHGRRARKRTRHRARPRVDGRRDRRRRQGRRIPGQGPARSLRREPLRARRRPGECSRRARSPSASQSATKGGAIRRRSGGPRAAERKSCSIPTSTTGRRPSPIRRTRFTKKRCCAARQKTHATSPASTSRARDHPRHRRSCGPMEHCSATSRTVRRACSSRIWI